MLTLDEFLADNRMPWNAYVKHPGFKELYVRKGPVYIKHIKCQNVVTIANVTASRKGKGAFTELVRYLQEDLGKHVAVECIHNERLYHKLIREGFQEYGAGGSLCLYRFACNTALQTAP